MKPTEIATVKNEDGNVYTSLYEFGDYALVCDKDHSYIVYDYEDSVQIFLETCDEMIATNKGIDFMLSVNEFSYKEFMGWVKDRIDDGKEYSRELLVALVHGYINSL